MWAVFVEPRSTRRQVVPHRFEAKRDDRAPEPFFFESFDEPLNRRDAAIPMDSAVARSDVLSLAPCFEAAARELHSFVADDVLGASGPPPDDFTKEGSHGHGRGLFLEHGETKD